MKCKLLSSDYSAAHFTFNTRQILGKEMPRTSFQVQTELDLKNYSSAGPALPLGPPSPSPQRGREQPGCLTTEGWRTLATFSCGNAACWHVRKAFSVCCWHFQHSQKTARGLAGITDRGDKPGSRFRGLVCKPFTASSKASGLPPQPQAGTSQCVVSDVVMTRAEACVRGN